MANPVIVVKAVHEIGRILGGYRHEIEIDRPMTVTEFVALLSARYGEEFKKKLTPKENTIWTAVLFVNGRNVLHLEGGETMLHDGDEFLIMTPLSGG